MNFIGFPIDFQSKYSQPAFAPDNFSPLPLLILTPIICSLSRHPFPSSARTTSVVAGFDFYKENDD